jgi:O-antigen/teichoic acid export membrane protein
LNIQQANKVETSQIRTKFSERVTVRFGATFVANLFRMGLSFFTGLIIARGLGASGYGNLNFLLGSFVAFNALLDLGTSSAFYTFISKRQRSRTFALLYLVWMAFQFVVPILVIGVLLPRNMIDRIWVGHEKGIVLVAFASSFMTTQLWNMLGQLAEATRKTVLIQIFGMIQAVVHLSLVLLVRYLGWLTVPIIMWLLVAQYLVLGMILGPSLLRSNLGAPTQVEDPRLIVRQFAAYCAPLVVYCGVSFLYTFADRWLLQRYSGSEQQGFFSVGQQVGSISLIATVAILRVMWKEVAEARERQDHARVRQLYITVTRALYFCSASIGCLLIPYSHEIVIRTVGYAYERAWPSLALMFVFPVHQSLGQIQSTIFYASEETKSYARIGMLTMVISIPITYFVLAPRSATLPGMGFGAAGLAIKTVAVTIMAVNLQGYVIARINGWPFDVAYQAVVLGTLLSLGWICKWLSITALKFAGSSGGPVKAIILSGIIYAGLLVALLYAKPMVAGLAREDVRQFVGGTIRWLRSTVASLA